METDSAAKEEALEVASGRSEKCWLNYLTAKGPLNENGKETPFARGLKEEGDNEHKLDGRYGLDS